MLIRYAEKHTHMSKKIEIAQGPEDDSGLDAMLQSLFVMQQLLEHCGCIDYSDEIGR